MKTSFYSLNTLLLIVALFSFSFSTTAQQAKTYSSDAILSSPVDHNALAAFLAGNNAAARTASPAGIATPQRSSSTDSGVVVSSVFGAIQGPSKVCGDDQIAVTYSVELATINGTSLQYYWFLPADWVILSGQGTNSISVIPGHMSGQVAVFAIGFCICSYSCMPVTSECDAPVTPLPVELISFDAARSQADVLLTWTTAMELDNDRFEIERSLNGRDFTTIASVKGHGSTNLRNDYRFVDNRASAALSYYRLKQVDYNGKYEYSSVRAVKASQVISNPISVFPNPAADRITVQLPSDLSSDALVTISSVTGQLMFSGTAGQLAASNQVIEMSRFTSGVYILNINSGSQNQSLRITKL